MLGHSECGRFECELCLLRTPRLLDPSTAAACQITAKGRSVCSMHDDTAFPHYDDAM